MYTKPLRERREGNLHCVFSGRGEARYNVATLKREYIHALQKPNGISRLRAPLALILNSFDNLQFFMGHTKLRYTHQILRFCFWCDVNTYTSVHALREPDEVTKNV